MQTHGLLEIAIVATVALIFGLMLHRMRQPAVVGYIVAGVLLGPSGFSLISDRGPVQILAELGVLMLLFIVGMELSLRGFKRVMRVSILCAALQIVLSVTVMLVVTRLFGRAPETGVLLGFMVALSSTAVAIKLLEAIDELRTDVGRTAVGVLIAQDLAVVPMLLVIDGMAGDGGFEPTALLKLLGAVGLLGGMIYVLTRRERVGTPFAKAAEGNIELSAIIALAYCFGAALLSALFGMSTAYGAFLAGLWIGNSTARSSILHAALPIQGVLLMVFFLSIGLLLDLQFIWAHFGEVLTMLLVVTLFKTVMNVAILRGVGEPWPRAWLAGVVIGQIGEFSFVLVATAVAAGLIGDEGSRLAVAVIALSLMLSPFWLLAAQRLELLVWPNVQTVGQLLRALFGRETRALAVVGRTTAAFTVELGERGSEAAHLLAERLHLGAEHPAGPTADAAFDDDETAPGPAPVQPKATDDA